MKVFLGAIGIGIGASIIFLTGGVAGACFGMAVAADINPDEKDKEETINA